MISTRISKRIRRLQRLKNGISSSALTNGTARIDMDVDVLDEVERGNDKISEDPTKMDIELLDPLRKSAEDRVLEVSEIPQKETEGQNSSALKKADQNLRKNSWLEHKIVKVIKKNEKPVRFKKGTRVTTLKATETGMMSTSGEPVIRDDYSNKVLIRIKTLGSDRTTARRKNGQHPNRYKRFRLILDLCAHSPFTVEIQTNHTRNGQDSKLQSQDECPDTKSDIEMIERKTQNTIDINGDGKSKPHVSKFTQEGSEKVKSRNQSIENSLDLSESNAQSAQDNIDHRSDCMNEAFPLDLNILNGLAKLQISDMQSNTEVMEDCRQLVALESCKRN